MTTTIKSSLRSIILLFLITFILCVFGCGRYSAKQRWENLPALVTVSAARLPDFKDDMAFEGLVEGISRSVEYLNKIPEDRMFVFGTDRYDTGHMLDSMMHFQSFIKTKPSSRELKQYISKHYRVYQSKGYNPDKEVLFTGYYEPILKGSPVRNRQNPHPVHSRPYDLLTVDLQRFSKKYQGGKLVGRLSGKTVIPYEERKDIVSDPLFIDKAPALAWVADPVALFFLHVQGSGRIAFPDGKSIRVHYHGTNGRPYRSIGKHLIETEKIPRPEMSMQAISDYLRNNPDEISSVLNYNPSYVFFEKVDKGPIGCIQTQLVPGRSIALDRATFPLAALSYIETQKPDINHDGQIDAWVDFSRFVLNQDTGGAIKGPGRADIFHGSGDDAEIAAGHMKHRGKLYFFVLKPTNRLT